MKGVRSCNIIYLWWNASMACSLRIESPGALYRVILCGNRRLSRLATA